MNRPGEAWLVAALLLNACGLDTSRGERFESEESVLPNEPPVESARLTTFGFPDEDMRQEIWVKLEAGTAVSEVFDMSVFAPLRPGATHAEAIEILGEPDSESVDGCGEKWIMFKRAASTVVVGCDHDTGFLPLSTFCSWSLYAELRPAEQVVASVLQPFIDAARSSPVPITLRTMHIQNENYSESVTYFFDAGDEADTATWRNGASGTRRAFCFGG